ncbi:hypothetical protein ALO92_200016 [Pseudomonas congelans]|uniref:ABC transporter substrate-binding protein n=1 Tax=Pseudomonas congelans TaxID=200452 RepID=A0A0P9M996_9PSED|nr:hypothetical protein ALO92_200016 [Pseudomonas congelans]
MWQIDQHGTQQRAVFQVQAALCLGGQFGQTLDAVQLMGPEQLASIQRAEGGVPVTVLLSEAQTQCVMLLDQRSQCRLKMNGLQRLQRLEHQRLIPVLALGDVQFEEARLNRQQRQRTADVLRHGGGLFLNQFRH